jgi:pyruvate-formate lyase-activating enzyme
MKKPRYKQQKTAKSKQYVTAVVADHKGQIIDLEGYAAVGMEYTTYVPLTLANTVEMPFGGEMMMLPDRVPVLYNLEAQRLESLRENPYEPGKPIFPVATFNSPGYVVTYISAYRENSNAGPLPLFSYGAIGWHRNGFRTSVIQVDSEPRQDLRQMKRENVEAGIERIRPKMPENRLRQHLEHCALEYGCPAGKNFFLGRYEAPLPTSQTCNAKCLGCISLQKETDIQSSQHRINFTPTPEEIAEVALEQILNVKNPVVSFGQGCEGDPLMATGVIAPAIKMIREKTPRGTINLNTNGSLPEKMETLWDAGLDSVRISMNSVRKACYDTYFRPSGYVFSDVLTSVDQALSRGKFVSINYLNCPGFTDTPQEVEALEAFMEKSPINMIQWRNLNFDPLRYWKIMNDIVPHGMPLGMGKIIKRIKKGFPNLKNGYFNPPREKFRVNSENPKTGNVRNNH